MVNGKLELSFLHSKLKMNKWVIVIDVGGTKNSAAIINKSGSIMFFMKEKVDKKGATKLSTKIENIIKHFFYIAKNFDFVGIRHRYSRHS